MGSALAAAALVRGETSPNPAVGCVIVRDGRIIARAATGRGGRPHAERLALEQATEDPAGATVYVTLEPCAHYGESPPCAGALCAAAPARVVIATGDPDPRVSGRGIARLAAAGISVTTGVLRDRALELNAAFFHRLRTGRAATLLKLAVSMDGRIAFAGGRERWITGPVARQFGHRLRAECDMVMVGARTAAQDDPGLDCRLPGFGGRQPMCGILFGSTGHASVPGRLLAVPDRQCVALVPGSDRALADRLAGVMTVLPCRPAAGGRVDLRDALGKLAGIGVNRVLVEGGGELAGALTREGLVDEICLLRAATVIGQGPGATGGFGCEGMVPAPRFRLAGMRRLGEDWLEHYTTGTAPRDAP